MVDIIDSKGQKASDNSSNKLAQHVEKSYLDWIFLGFSEYTKKGNSWVVESS